MIFTRANPDPICHNGGIQDVVLSRVSVSVALQLLRKIHPWITFFCQDIFKFIMIQVGVLHNILFNPTVAVWTSSGRNAADLPHGEELPLDPRILEMTQIPALAARR